SGEPPDLPPLPTRRSSDLEPDKDTCPEAECICHDILELIQVLKHKSQSDDIDECLHDAECCCCITVPFKCCNGAHRQKAHIYDIDDEYDKHHQPGVCGNGCYHAKFPLCLQFLKFYFSSAS